ncbi:MAG: SpoIIE family protein phosphatase [Anaerolineae bacterium]|nr:SpoIIE family protein phosphatase [Anaerolineae bacterium]
MTAIKSFWRKEAKAEEAVEPVVETAVSTTTPPTAIQTFDLDIGANDPFLTYCLNSKGVIDVDKLLLDSPAVAQMKASGVRLVVPLVSQGDLIGLINLGSRLSEQEYTSDDMKLLQDLSTQAAPALKVTQLVQQQKLEAIERERIQQELRVARLIQQTLLPQELPQVAGWQVDAYYQPARAVGGDFYDFIYFADGRIAFIVADVTDKGVPAALVMATTRSILRAAAERLESPGAVLERTNNVLVQEIPPKMFVTCFVALLNPHTGHLRYANAGHDVPYHYTKDGLQELRATGMPLGLMPGMSYEEKETTLAPDDYFLLYSDGLVEAHAPDREMFGFPRLQTLMAGHGNGRSLNQFLLDELAAFTGAGWEQEDDVTLVTIQRLETLPSTGSGTTSHFSFEIPSEPGNERLAMTKVAEIVGDALPSSRLEKLKTAVAEATMNAMEHGNKYDEDKPVVIEVALSETAASTGSGRTITVRITDQGGGKPVNNAATPDLDAKLAGEQSPRGWGLFLIKNMVDEMHVIQDETHHTIELVMNVESGD